jgi:nuclease S1
MRGNFYFWSRALTIQRCSAGRARGIQTARLALCGLLLLVCGAAQAWSVPGHRMIGSMAESELTPAAAKQVKRLLAGEAEPTLAGVSAWADQIRESDSALARLSGPWHYVNFPLDGCDYVPTRDCKNGQCLVAALQSQIALLKNRKASRAQRADALKWVVHLIADVHQPLHTGYGFDRGGNDFQINWLGEGNNLHWVWDRMLLSTRGITESQHVQLLQQLQLPPDPLLDSTDPALDYALESCRLLRSVPIYPKSRKLKMAYIDTFLPVAESQVKRAAERLARLLNTIFASPTR